MKHPFLLLAAVLMLAAGCNETEQPLNIDTEQPLTLPAAGGTATLTFTAPSAWSASLLPNVADNPTDWLAIDPTSGTAGQHTITLTAQANENENSRSLSISLSSGQQTTPVLITQLGTADTDSTDTPVFVPETAIRQVTILDPDDGTEANFAFEYDGEGRVVRMQGSDQYEGETHTYLYTMAYEGSTVTVDGDDGVHIVGTLDAQGRATRVAYTETLSPEGGGSGSPTRTDITLTYDAEGRLTQEVGEEDGYNEYTYDYTWTGGDLTRVHLDYYDADYAYSTHANTGNIDLNWLLTAGYGSGGIAPFGIFNLLGTRSTHLAVPDYWADMAATPDQMLLVCEDDLNKPVTKEGMYYEDGETTTEYRFEGPEGSLSFISRETPVEAVHYRQTGTITDHNPEAYEMRDGKKYYYDLTIDWGEREITSRDHAWNNRQEVTVGY